MTIKVSEKGWVVIPASLRRKYRLTPGAEIHVIDYGGVLAIVPVELDPIQSSFGKLSGKGRSLIQALLDDHRQEMEGE